MECLPCLSLHRVLFNGYTFHCWRTMVQRNYATRDYYDILSVSRNCTNQDIRNAFAKLSKKFHPDLCKAGDVKQNTKRFQEIVEAYKVLGKQENRDTYDLNGMHHSRVRPRQNYYSNSYWHSDAYRCYRKRPGSTQWKEYYNVHRPGASYTQGPSSFKTTAEQEQIRSRMLHIFVFLFFGNLFISVIIYRLRKSRYEQLQADILIEKYNTMEDLRNEIVKRQIVNIENKSDV